MRKIFVPALLAASLGTTGFAAAMTADGTIRTIDRMQGHVTLDSGSRYDFATRANHETLLGNFKVGDAVSITYAPDGSSRTASGISPVNDSHTLVGALERVDRATGKVIVAGVGVDLSQLPDIAARLDTFKIGDRVQVAYGHDGAALTGLSLSPASGADTAITAGLAGIDRATGTVTLDGGTRVKFEDGDLIARLANFKDGDMVHITYVHEGTALVGETISPAS